jgi:glycosyltransferase involved in cell wall biosynthesis
VISVVVPVHDEERSVALLYDELDSALQPIDEPWEAVFVDDGSTDGTRCAAGFRRSSSTRSPAGSPASTSTT